MLIFTKELYAKFVMYFLGGAAEKCGGLKVRDEMLSVNDIDVTSMSRFEVWTIMKKLPDDTAILLRVRR